MNSEHKTMNNLHERVTRRLQEKNTAPSPISTQLTGNLPYFGRKEDVCLEHDDRYEPQTGAHQRFLPRLPRRGKEKKKRNILLQLWFYSQLPNKKQAGNSLSDLTEHPEILLSSPQLPITQSSVLQPKCIDSCGPRQAKSP